MLSYLLSWMTVENRFTSTSPLPPSITPERVIEVLHDHVTMIKLNPLVIDLQRCEPHKDAPATERDLVWYEITDKVSYLPFGLFSGKVKYKGCFEDLPMGLQTHIYAPLGLRTKNTWTIEDELQLKEDVFMTCNILMAPFVKATIKASHGPLVERLIMEAELPDGDRKSSVGEHVEGQADRSALYKRK
ncbi:hypothetical protein BDV32DRAFT_148848 [Aspergillus pseudonomiae]|uniref:DUF7053 domain-containing protein n=1 Tax=Aspergillus pseudonomiae TaxID=1506151 RepID=A0A5N6I2Z4_9EURO|nr:uncharacterized protein BDV37DRAFT_246409 [Aspergillus pseudonomiae]KAB8260976.1 hypothetical protein BDV32DRAFT_148848 [Aspergillus pseudonomiae]KAE8404833.1 hypothetical protein BDV37DRAFT_246409 [Aspergillus pseudonomiae]